MRFETGMLPFSVFSTPPLPFQTAFIPSLRLPLLTFEFRTETPCTHKAVMSSSVAASHWKFKRLMHVQNIFRQTCNILLPDWGGVQYLGQV